MKVIMTGEIVQTFAYSYAHVKINYFCYIDEGLNSNKSTFLSVPLIDSETLNNFRKHILFEMNMKFYYEINILLLFKFMFE